MPAGLSSLPTRIPCRTPRASTTRTARAYTVAIDQTKKNTKSEKRERRWMRQKRRKKKIFMRERVLEENKVVYNDPLGQHRASNRLSSPAPDSLNVSLTKRFTLTPRWKLLTTLQRGPMKLPLLFCTRYKLYFFMPANTLLRLCGDCSY